MMRRMLAVLTATALLGGVALVWASGPAPAQETGLLSCPTSVTAGVAFTVTAPAGSFQGGSTVALTAETVPPTTTISLGTTTAAGDGSIATSVTIAAAGTYQIFAAGEVIEVVDGADVSYSQLLTCPAPGVSVLTSTVTPAQKFTG